MKRYASGDLCFSSVVTLSPNVHEDAKTQMLKHIKA